MRTIWAYEIGDGWYIRIDGGDFDPEEVRFHDVGNGVEPYYPDDVLGPYPTQHAAALAAWSEEE